MPMISWIELFNIRQMSSGLITGTFFGRGILNKLT